jgi:hypothetical protein
VEDAINAIKNACAGEAYGNVSSGGSDPANYGEFKVTEDLKIEITIKMEKDA